MPPTTQEISRAISEINWFHTINLGNGVTTPGRENSALKLQHLHLPDDLTGLTFLDVGAWDGFFSFEAERRGAARVLATDFFIWNGEHPQYSKQGFLTARSILNSKVEDLTIDALSLSPDNVGMFDVVLLSDVLYHVKHPWLLLEKVASVTRKLLIVRTSLDLCFGIRPAIVLYPKSELAGDPTNWCAPNLPALKAMLRECGFPSVKTVYCTSLLGAILYYPSEFKRHRTSPLVALQRRRGVVHATR